MLLINKIENYNSINKNLLSLIEKIPNNSLVEGSDRIFHTDYNLPSSTKREYVDYFLQIIQPSLKLISEKFHAKKIEITKIWFQQYIENDYHGWHVHPSTHFTNVYFIELPSKNFATQIYHHEQIDINEGYLITFPAHWFHRSPQNTSLNRKTIISFNLDLLDFKD
jgi:hypothetical protein